VTSEASSAADGVTDRPRSATTTVATTDVAGVRTVRIDRPDAMNALDLATKIAFRDAVLAAADDAAVRCLVVTGTGRAFCVGQDLREHTTLQQARDESLWSTVPEHYNPTALALATMRKPVVAAVNGVAAGAGAAFAFAADLRIVAASAGFNLAFTAIGLSADSGASWWLPRLVGVTRAMDLLLRPRTVGASEALDLGLATEVVPDADLADRVTEVAGRLAAGPTLAFGAVRRAVAYSATHDLQAALAHESELMDLTGASSDHAAAVAAFLAKEKPRFEGR
jgi:2-(1,2-epoxy-1,2-dihydrophenyl)acetyl-CoA isomerase